MTGSRPRPPGLLALAVVAATLHAATAIVVPVLHAEAEVYQSAEELETTHTAQCPKLHADASCVVCPAFQLLPDAPALVADQLPDDRAPRTAGAPPLHPQPQRPEGHPVRAPPA